MLSKAAVSAKSIGANPQLIRLWQAIANVEKPNQR